MATYIETLLQRGRIAAAASRFLRSEAGKSVCSEALVPGVEEIAMVPAAPHESAVLTFHRMEATQSKTVVLASMIGDKGALVVGTTERLTDLADGRKSLDLVGSMTTEEWLRLIRDREESLSFTANGNEFAAELSRLNSFATA